MIRLRNQCVLGLLLGASLLLAGCGRSGPTPVPVQGNITREGQPLKGAAVMFLPAAGGRPATGVTDDAGVFHLQTFQPNDGAIPGEYRVSVAFADQVSSEGVKADNGVVLSGSSGPATGPKSTGYEKYARPDESGLTATVTSPNQSFTFDLKPK